MKFKVGDKVFLRDAFPLADNRCFRSKLANKILIIEEIGENDIIHLSSTPSYVEWYDYELLKVPEVGMLVRTKDIDICRPDETDIIAGLIKDDCYAADAGSFVRVKAVKSEKGVFVEGDKGFYWVPFGAISDIIPAEQFVNLFTKEALKTHSFIIECNNKKRYVSLGDNLIGMTGFLEIDDFEDDLSHAQFDEYSIRAIYPINYIHAFSDLKNNRLFTRPIWERPQVKDITMREAIDRLSKIYGAKVRIIQD